MRWRSVDGRGVDHAAQILHEGFVHLVVGQGLLPLVADQIKESKGEPLLEQGQAAWAGPGCEICGPGLQLRAEDLLIAMLQQPGGFLPGFVLREEVETRLKSPWRQGLIRVLLLCPVDKGLTWLDRDGSAVDDLHGGGGHRIWQRRHVG